MAILSTVGTFVYRTELLGAGANENPNYSGAVMVFQQTSAPTGWTKLTTDNDAILTITTGTPTTGGLTNFSTVFGTSVSLSGTVSFPTLTVDGTTLTAPQMPPHNHTFWHYADTPAQRIGPPTAILGYGTQVLGPGISGVTAGQAHTHPAPAGGSTSTPFINKDLRVKYVDVILASFA